MPVPVLLLAWAAGCGSSDSEAEQSWAVTTNVSNAVPADSKLAEGQWRFLYDAWGTELAPDWPTVDFMLALMKNEPEVFGNQFSKFGFIPDPSDDLPLGFKRGLKDKNRVQQTCALCHTSKLPDGRIWFGLANSHIDRGRFVIEVNKRWVAAGNPPIMRPGDLALSKQAGAGPGRLSAEGYDNPVAVPVDMPSLLRMGPRARFNYLGTGQNLRSEVYLSMYGQGAGSPDDERGYTKFPDEAHVGAFIAFVASLEPPPAPPQDPSRVEAGKAVFQKATCNSCHDPDHLDRAVVATYNAEKEIPPGVDPNFPRGTIRTAPNHLTLVSGAGNASSTSMIEILRFMEKFNLRSNPTDGYRMTPLVALWATPPFLHNGSVPTLEDLLKPASERPKTWDHDGFTFDTTVPGNENYGHEFGADLSDAEKADLVTYLKTL